MREVLGRGPGPGDHGPEVPAPPLLSSWPNSPTRHSGGQLTALTMMLNRPAQGEGTQLSGPLQSLCDSAATV